MDVVDPQLDRFTAADTACDFDDAFWEAEAAREALDGLLTEADLTIGHKDDSHSLTPEGLDEIAPGPFLAILLASIDASRCAGDDRVRMVQAHNRMASHHQASMYGAITAVADHLEAVDDGDLELAHDGTVAEVRATLRLTRRAADAEVDLALDLSHRLPILAGRFRTGDLDLRRIKTIVFGTAHLSEDGARAVTNTIIDDAKLLTTGQLNARIRKLCIDVDTGEATERYEQAVEQRRVIVQPTETGAATLLGLDLPANRAANAAARINALARSLKTANESRTMDQLRADVLLDLLEGSEPNLSRTKGVVNIHVDLDTLARLENHAGDLAGYGPVIADVARQIAEGQTDQQWQFTVTDPATGQPTHTGVTRRRPTASQRRHIRATDRTCVWTGCRMPAHAADLDHTKPWADGGPTTNENLAPLCEHDHTLKQRLGWTYQRLDNGSYEWTSKLGRKYRSGGPSP